MWKLILNEERNNLALLHVVQRCKRMRYVLGAFQTLAASRCDSFPVFFTPIPIFLPFPVCFQVLSAGFQTLALELCFIPPSRQTQFPLPSPIPFHRPGEPVFSPDPLCLPTSPTQFLAPRRSFLLMLPEKQGEDWKDGFPARPGYVQTWHGPG